MFGSPGDQPVAGNWPSPPPQKPASAPQPTPQGGSVPGGNQIGGSDVQPILPNPPNQNEPVLFQPPNLDQAQTPPSLLTRKIAYTYDNLDRLTGAVYTDNSTPTFNYQYTYDFNSNRTFALGQNFISATNPTFQATNSSYNLANQLTTSTDQNGSTAFTYNADGTLSTQLTTPYASGQSASSTSYSYDLADRLTNVTAPNGSTTGYTYDGMGDRVSASTHTGSTSTYTTYLVDPSGSIPQILAEYPNSGLPTYYVPAGTLIGQDSGTSGGLSYFATDGLGSVRSLLGGSTSGLANYDPYGSTLPDSGAPGIASHIGYTGAMTDANGLVYLNARYYDPGLGDFLSSDPLAGQPPNPATFNLYGYVQGNPITGTDPSGKTIADIACGIASYVLTDNYSIGAEECDQVETELDSTPAGQAVGSAISNFASSVGNWLLSNPVTGTTANNVMNGWAVVQNTVTADHVSAGANYLWQQLQSIFSGSSTSNAPTNGDSSGSPGSDPGCSNSFSPDTLVATDHGEVAISALKVGDKVLAYDEQTGKTEYEPVDAVLVNRDPVTELVTINGELIRTTPGHPFYTADRGWVKAGDLKIGETVLSDGKSYGMVELINYDDQPHLMYNLTVDTDHTFFVGKGMWLVHNQLPCDLKVSISDILKNYPLSSFQCTNCAGELFRLFQQAGYSPQIGRIISNTPFLVLQDGTLISDAAIPYHDFVLVNGVVYDAIAGADGLPLDQYLKLFYPSTFGSGTVIWTLTYLDDPAPPPGQ